MNMFEKLLQEAENDRVRVYDFDLGGEGLDGLYMDGNIALSDKLETTCQKACVLAEELGHHYTTVGDILDQSTIKNQKQERIARGWAYNKLVPFTAIQQAHEAGYFEAYEVAEYLDVDEEFLKESLEYYEQKYGDEIIKKRQEREFKEALMLAGIEFEG